MTADQESLASAASQVNQTLAGAGIDVLGDMKDSGGRPRDLTHQQLALLKTAFEDQDVGLYLFSTQIFGYKDLTTSIHLPISRFLGKWGMSETTRSGRIWYPPTETDGDITDSWRRLMVCIPREHFKTSMCTRALALWTLARNPDATIGIFNEKEENAQSWTASIAEVVECSVLFQLIWRDIIPMGIGFWDKEAGRSRPRGLKWGGTGLKFERPTIGIPELSIEPRGIGGAVTGKHYTHKILDDIIGEKTSDSVALMQDAINWVDHSRPLERPAENGQELVVHTPWAYADVYAHMLKKWPGEYKVHKRHLLENDKGEPDTDGKSIFPQKVSTQKAKKMMKTDPFVFWCLPSNAPILMADLSERAMSDVRVGDELFGVTSKNGKACLVTNKQSTIGPLYRYHLKDGTWVDSTPNHRWSTVRRGKVCYLEAEKCKLLRRVYYPWEDTDFGPGHVVQRARWECHSWLGGFYDGDGSLCDSSLHFTQKTTAVEILDRLRQYLTESGFKFNETTVAPGGVRRPNEIVDLWINGGRSSKIRFLQRCNPAKRAPIVKSVYERMGRLDRVPVVGVEYRGEQTVWSIETTTGNYVAYGYLSSNSQYMCIPKAGRTLDFADEWFRFGKLVYSGHEPVFSIDVKYYDPEIYDLEVDTSNVSPPRLIPLSWMEKALIFDPIPGKESERKKETYCRHGIVIVGKDPWGRRFCLESERSDLDETSICHRILELSQKWNVDSIGVEAVSAFYLYGPLLTQIAERYWGDYLPDIVYVEPEGRQKDQRIRQDLGPAHQNGYWYYNREGTSEAIQELTEFPHSTYKDVSDAQSYTDKACQRPSTPEEARSAWYSEKIVEQSRGLTGYGEFF